jgi:hypothetical protein
MANEKLHCFSNFPPLDNSLAEIRLFDLQPGTTEDAIEGDFQIRSLQDATLSYETLSYAWRDIDYNESATRTIKISGQSAEISSTLFNAIKRLRHDEEVRCLWIDAICINQSDDDEKTQQVNMMRRIYKQCNQCAIWLGSLGLTPSQAAEHALQLVTWIAGETDDPPFMEDSAPAAAALHTFISSPWWRRIWTVQEALLPPKATLYWGPYEISWNALLECATRLVEERGPDGIPDEFWDNESLGDIQATMNGLRFSFEDSPLHLFQRWRFRSATDPRDKIYGLMGIHDDMNLPSVQSCDYAMSTNELFTRVTADLIRVGGNLEPLIGRRGEPPREGGLPSWVVDWSGPREGHDYSRFWPHQITYCNEDYTADRGLYGVGDGLRMADDRTLILNGLFVDKIAVVERYGGSDDEHGTGSTLFHSTRADRWGDLIMEYQNWITQHKATDIKESSWMSSFLGLITGKLVPADPDHGPDPDFWHSEMMAKQSIFVTEQGRFGLGPVNSRPGQEVWVVGGCRFPLILEACARLQGAADGKHTNLDFVFRGDCFVHGIMMGEVVGERADDQSEIRLH